VPVHYQITGSGAAEIVASVETGMRQGPLRPGALLPPVRGLAADLGVAPATVAAAYRTLRDRGLVETAGRNGTRVRHRPPLVAAIGRPAPAPPGTVDLSTGEPDRGRLPALGPRLRRLAGTASEPLRYADSGPWPDLVTLGRERLAADGVPVQSGAVTITSGALDAIERLLAAHLRPGDTVGVEDPGWANLIDLVAALGLHAVPMPVDDDGPTVDGLRAAVRAGAAAVVVTSRAQNPTGATVSPQRAAGLRRVLASAPQVLVIEDDHAGELAARPLAPLAAAGPRWAFVRSVSKPYGPDLRVAVVAADEATTARVEGRMRLGAGWVSSLLQRLVVELWRDDTVAATVDKAGRAYDRRRDGLVAALAERGVPAHGRSGINVWIPVPDDAAAVGVLRDAGWAVSPGSRHRQASPPGIRVTVSTLSLDAVPALADAITGARTSGRSRGSAR